jgi:hypothetical protein
MCITSEFKTGSSSKTAGNTYFKKVDEMDKKFKNHRENCNTLTEAFMYAVSCN